MKASAEKIQERKRVMIMKKKEQNLDRFQFSTSCRNAIIQHEKHYTTTPAKDWNEAKHIFSQGTKYFNLGLQLFSFEEELVQRVRVNQLLSKLYKQLAAFKQEKIANNDALDRVSKIQWRRIKCLELSLGFCDPEANLIQVDKHRQTSLTCLPRSRSSHSSWPISTSSFWSSNRRSSREPPATSTPGCSRKW